MYKMKPFKSLRIPTRVPAVSSLAIVPVRIGGVPTRLQGQLQLQGPYAYVLPNVYSTLSSCSIPTCASSRKASSRNASSRNASSLSSSSPSSHSSGLWNALKGPYENANSNSIIINNKGRGLGVHSHEGEKDINHNYNPSITTKAKKMDGDSSNITNKYEYNKTQDEQIDIEAIVSTMKKIQRTIQKKNGKQSSPSSPIHIFQTAIQDIYELIHNCPNYPMECTHALSNTLNLVLNYGKRYQQQSKHYEPSKESRHNPNHVQLVPVVLDILQEIEKLAQGGHLFHHHHHHHHGDTENNDANSDYYQSIDLRKTYNLVIDILSRGRQLHREQLKNHPNQQSVFNSTTEIIHKIIQRMENAPQHWDVSPDIITYNSLLYDTSLKHYKNVATDCESLLRRMAHLTKGQVSGQGTVNTISYNIVLNAWAKSHSKDAGERGERLIKEMQDLYNSGRNVYVKPNVITYTTLLNIYSKSKDLDVANKAMSLLYQMEEDGISDILLQPSIQTYTTVLNVWANSHLPGSSQRAQDLLEHMICNWETRTRDHVSMNKSTVRPNTISFAICIKAHARGDEKGSSQKAMSLLNRMIDLADNHNLDTQPDVSTYNSVIRSLDNDSQMEEEKAIRAELILHQMVEERGLVPDLQIYNLILRCCCNTRSGDVRVQRAALRIATDVLLNIRQTEGLSPDPYTFNFFVKACDRLLPSSSSSSLSSSSSTTAKTRVENGNGGSNTTDSSEKQKLKLIHAAFQFCIEEGKFSKPVLSIMKNALKPNEFRDMLQLDRKKNLQNLKVSDFPKEWRNRL